MCSVCHDERGKNRTENLMYTSDDQYIIVIHSVNNSMFSVVVVVVVVVVGTGYPKLGGRRIQSICSGE